MAKLIFGLDEVVRAMASNEQLAGRLSDIRIDGDMVLMSIKTGIPFMSHIPASVRFDGFEDGKARLELDIANLSPAMAKGAIGAAMGKFADKIPDFVSFDYPMVTLDVEKMLAGKGTPLRIEDVAFAAGEFTVTAGLG